TGKLVGHEPSLAGPIGQRYPARGTRGNRTLPMRAAVIVFPGLNADAEMIRTLGLAGATVTTVWHADTSLPSGTDLVAIPGGFSYGDYLRCGAIAKVGPIMAAIADHAKRGGWVLGVCNRFPILARCGLRPVGLTRKLALPF